MKKPRVISLRLAVVLGAVAIGLFITGWFVRETGDMMPPILTVPVVYDGHIAAYWEHKENIAASRSPIFSVRVINRDEQEFREHLANQAARHHWLCKGGELYTILASRSALPGGLDWR